MKVLLLVFALFIVWSKEEETFKVVDLEGCKTLKGCFRPMICEEESCSFIATWKLVSEDSLTYVEFELKGYIKKNTGFISLAFSNDKKVGDDGVVGCYYNPSSRSVHVKAAYNNEETKESIFYTGTDSDLLITEGGDLGGDYNSLDQTLQCRFRRRLKPIEWTQQLKDLTAPNSYYLIVSRGSEIGSRGFAQPFAGGESMSDEAVVVTSPVYGAMTHPSQHASKLMKIHGCLMVLAWVLCASVGVIMARYYKELWPNSRVLNRSVWLHTHGTLQICCASLTTIAIILAIVYCRGYSAASVYPFYIHPILGFIVFSLALLNPLLAICQCPPDSAHRPWFNWIHFFVGTFAHVLSIPTMMLGLRMPAAGFQLQFLNYPLWILIFFVIFQFFVELILEIHGCMYYRRNKEKMAVYRNDVYQSRDMRQRRQGYPEPSGHRFKLFMLGLHSTVAAAVAVILIIIIAVY